MIDLRRDTVTLPTEALSDGNIRRLKNDHTNARTFAEKLTALPQVSIDQRKIHTNFVVPRFSIRREQLSALPDFLAERGILVNTPKKDTTTFVFSKQVRSEDIDFVIDAVADYIKQ